MTLFRPIPGLPAVLVLMFCLVAGTPAAMAQQNGPQATIQNTVDSVLAILRKPDYNFEADREEIKTEVISVFDATAMAQSVLSTAWRSATKEQQQEFQDLLVQIIENSYIDRIRAYTYENETVEYRGEDIREGRASVDTVIVTDTNRVPVTYKLRQRSDGWFVYDVEVENVSMVSSYRETYRSVVGRSGMDGLLQQMRDKLAELGAV